MGSSQNTQHLSLQYNIEGTFGNSKIISKNGNPSDMYLMKSYHTNQLEEHINKIQYFRKYKAKMSDNQQITKLLQIIEEKQEGFCSNSFKTHLIYQYSPVSVKTEIKERQKKIKCDGPADKQYFNYEDLCSILYSCLSALWLVQETILQGVDREIKQFNTAFLTTENILIFDDGAIKIMDPHTIGYQSRYVRNQNVYYSPQKLRDFYQNDDEKCSIFQLGMVLLQVSLLQSMKPAYDGLFQEQFVAQKLKKARKIYSSNIQGILGVSVFDIIQKMIQVNRQNRLNLEETIKYAQEMYQGHQEAPPITKVNKKQRYVNSSQKKRQLKLTNHSSSGKKRSPSLSKFYDFKDSLVCEQSRNINCKSPQISNFTIQQVSDQKYQQSSMLQSLKVQNPTKINGFSESMGNGNIFSNLNLNDSYNYNWYLQKTKQQQLFTDPQLLNSIFNELKQIESRKKEKLQKRDLTSSQAIQRKSRYYYQVQQKQITNQAYLIE